LGNVGKKTPGISATSIDIDAARKPDLVMDATALSFDSGTFDAVYMMEVLEHVNEPRTAIAEVHRILTNGGRFVLSTPFVFGIHEEPWDYLRFTRHGLDHLLVHFSDVSIRARNMYYGSIVVLFMRAIFSPGRSRQAIGGFAMIVGLPFFVFLLLIDRLFPDDRSTTGYFITCNKP
jgi:SAM-dependent methyltransferase